MVTVRGMITFLVFLGLLFVVPDPAAILAQTTTGTIVGRVTDATGAVIPGASVTVVSEDTGMQRSLVSGDEGHYEATLLPIGRYRIEAEQPGFKTRQVSDILLQVNQTVRVDLALEVGEISEVVQVESTAAVVQTDRSDVGVVIDETQVVELPLNGRLYIQLAMLGGGTINAKAVDGAMVSTGGGIVVNGANSNSNAYTLDGIDNQGGLQAYMGTRPNPDAIQEFKVMAGNYSAEFGRSSGARVNVAIKSGTNEFHGSAYWFHRNDNLDARSFFDPSELPEFKWNQWGGSIGGPVIKDQTFFFFSYESFRIPRGVNVRAILPTDAQRRGDLSGGGRPIFDPLTTRTDPETGMVIRDPFPGNIIPSDRLSPESLRVLELLYPQAQTQVPYRLNSSFNREGFENQDQWIIRADHSLSDSSTIWGRYLWSQLPKFQPTFRSSGLPGFGVGNSFFLYNGVAGWTKNFSSNMVNDFRVGYNRWRLEFKPKPFENLNEQIGLEGTLDDPGAPWIRVTGITDIQAGWNAPSLHTTNAFEYIDTLAVTKGNHSVKIGADIRRHHLNGPQFALSRGEWRFDGRMTRSPADPAGTGEGLADFLLGFPNFTRVWRGKSDSDIRAIHTGFFFQDDWSVHPDITLNLGLRYNYMPPPISYHDRIVAWSESNKAIVVAQNDLNEFSFVDPSRTVAAQISDFSGIFNVMTRQEAGYPRSLSPPGNDTNNWAPRLGLAWRFLGTNDTVLRGGWGRFYHVVPLHHGFVSSRQAPYNLALAFTCPANSLPCFTLKNGFPGGSAQGAPGVGGGVHNVRDPYQDNWNLTLEQRLFRNNSLAVAYVGSRGVGDWFKIDWNGPVFGIGSPQQRRPFPQRGGSSNLVPWGRRSYDSMQVTWRTQRSDLSLLASYTWGNSRVLAGGGVQEAGKNPRTSWNFFGARDAPTDHLDPSDRFLAIDRSPGSIDMRHRLSVSNVWLLPFGSGQRYSLSGPIDWIFGGWQLTGITTLESGLPISVALGRNNTGSSGTSRPDMTGNPNTGPKTPREWFRTSAFRNPRDINDIVAGRGNPIDALGNAGRNVIRTPGLQVWDIGIFKNFSILEELRLQIRAEMFNAFNRANFNNPNTSFVSPLFGQITRAALGREIQMGIRFTW